MKIWLKKLSINPVKLRTKFIFNIFLAFSLMLFFYNYANATDLLSGTTGDVMDTMKGSGRNWAYIVDGAISLGAFAKTKNPFVFFSVLAVAVGITVISKMAGGN